MRIVIFGLGVSAAWENHHAAVWRSLIGGLDTMGHHVVFFEQDTPHHRAHRDLVELGGRARLCLYPTWSDIRAFADATVREADVAIVTSRCGREAAELVLGSRVPRRAFYDLDTPVTLGDNAGYLPASGLRDFDIVLSLTGGSALDELRERAGAQLVAPIYPSVDPKTHVPVPARSAWSAECSYLGPWSSDQQAALEALFVEPARRQRERPFVVGGAKLPAVAWPPNVSHVEHVTPPEHAAFYCSSPLTLSTTPAEIAMRGHCPSARLFEAAACGVPVLSDRWQGIEAFFARDEILVADTTEDAVGAMTLSRSELAAIGKRARERVLEEHTGLHRAAELLALLETDDFTGEAA
jgi:spore maturation protein CgeB